MYKMNLNCIYKFTVKPTTIKNVIPASKRVKLLEEVQEIEDTMEELEDEFQSLLSASIASSKNKNHHLNNRLHLSSSSLSSIYHITKEKENKNNKNNWNVMIKPNRQGLQLQTNIHNLSELVQFLNQSHHLFSPSVPKTVNAFSNSLQQTMVVKNKILPVEYTLRAVFGKEATLETIKKNHHQSSLSTFNNTCYSSIHYTQSAIVSLIDNYMCCVRGMVPIVSSYYIPWLINHPTTTLTYALSAFIALSHCVHVNEKSLPCSRSEFGMMLYQLAEEKMRDDLFDDEPTVELICALFAMVNAALILVRTHDAILYLHIAWQMVLDLKDEQLKILKKYQQQQQQSSSSSPTCSNKINLPTTPELARAETWRRLFYGVRFMYVNVLTLKNDHVDFTSLLSESNIGYPHLLQCEFDDEQRKRRIESYSLFVQLDDCLISNKIGSIGYRLLNGTLEKASLADITKLEHRLFTFWKGLPTEYHLTEQPMEYVNPSRIEFCENIHLLHLNLFYYASWLTLECRFMESPMTADLSNASLTKLDSHRALIITSICSDTLTHIFQTLYHRQPCMLDLHWVLITTDILRMLATSTNESIRHQASFNLQRCLPILMSLMQPKLLPSSSSNHQQQHHHHHTPSLSPSSSTSVPSLITPTHSTSTSTTSSSNHSSSSNNNSNNNNNSNVFSPSVSSISTTCDSLEDDDDDYEVDDEWQQQHHPSDPLLCKQKSTDECETTRFYFGGEIKKNLQSYFPEPSI
ncbi:unnamed protein product [Cunninghamella blakesleeana]